MSFTTFLVKVGKIAIGYGGALFLFLAAMSAVIQGYNKTAAVLGIIAVLLALYGVYSERGL